jgi:hypothetical protein
VTVNLNVTISLLVKVCSVSLPAIVTVSKCRFGRLLISLHRSYFLIGSVIDEIRAFLACYYLTRLLIVIF